MPFGKKDRIPFEISNAREWDPNYKKPDHPSEQDSDDEDYFSDDDDALDFEYAKPYSSGLQSVDSSISHDTPSAGNGTVHTKSNGNEPKGITDDGFQTVSYKNRSNKDPKPKSNAQTRQQARPRVVFNFKKDNLARAAFRDRQPPKGKLTLHRDPGDLGASRDKMYDLLEEIGVRCHSFIRPPQTPQDRDLLIWGNDAQVQNTVVELNNWLSQFEEKEIKRTLAKKNFAKEHSVISARYKRMQKQIAQEAAIHRYQQNPEEGRIFDYTGSFLWPVDEVRPEELFGSSLEAFDPVRSKHQCHVVFENKLSVFRILANDPDSVTKAMERIEGAFMEYVARGGRHSTEYLIEPPSSSAMRTEVRRLPGPVFGSAARTSGIPVLTGRVLNTEARDSWANHIRKMTVQNNLRLEQALRKVIPNLPFYRGQLQMRINYGTFALTQYRWAGTETIPFSDFLTNMAMQGTKGVMIRDLQVKKDAATILSKVHSTVKLFQPISNSIYTLQEVAPSFGARFQFKESDQPTHQLDVEMHSDSMGDDNLYEKTQSLWTRADRRDDSTLLTVFNIQVEGGCSWKLELSTQYPINNSRVNPRMKDFANSVKLKKSAKTRSELTGERMFGWEKDLPGTMRPVSFEQKTSFKYRLEQNTDWMFEIARYDTFGDARNENLPVRTCWAATLWNTEWDTTLTHNAGLAIGQSAKWDPKLATFFPKKETLLDEHGVDGGIVEFAKIVQTITKFIDELKKEQPHLRT